MKTITKVETWLPVFSGFYETIWDTDNDEESELSDINAKRRDKGLPECSWDDVEWDYEEYQVEVAKGMTECVGDWLKQAGYIKGYKYQKLVSPREYNFANDSVYVVFTFSSSNRKNIAVYLENHRAEFTEYVQRRYTSYDGFISRHSNDAREWITGLDRVLQDKHEAAAVLNFIILNEEKDFEMQAYEDLTGNGACLFASNYGKLIAGGK